jgi:hypothetical protein
MKLGRIVIGPNSLRIYGCEYCIFYFFTSFEEVEHEKSCVVKMVTESREENIK